MKFSIPYTIQQIKQMLCNHEVNYTTSSGRDQHGNIHAQCIKCGMDLSADCYLNMDAKPVRKGKYSEKP